MENAYLIIDPAQPLARIVKANYFYRWDWKDEILETEKVPYTRVYFDNKTETYIYYREEHKGVFKTRYFYVEGEDINSVLEKLKAAANILDIKDLIKKYNESDVPLERGSAIYQLGIALCGSSFDYAIYNSFELAIKDKEPGVRIAALAGMAWLGWEELIPIIEEVEKDSCDDVSRYAQTLEEAFAFSKVCKAFTDAVKREDENVQKKFQVFNTISDELMGKFPNIKLESVAKETDLQLNIEFEQVLEEVKSDRKFGSK